MHVPASGQSLEAPDCLSVGGDQPCRPGPPKTWKEEGLIKGGSLQGTFHIVRRGRWVLGLEGALRHSRLCLLWKFRLACAGCGLTERAFFAGSSLDGRCVRLVKVCRCRFCLVLCAWKATVLF